MSAALFEDRRDGGWRLAERLRDHAGRQDVVVLGPRGGVPVAYEVATALGAPLDVFLVCKLGVPGWEELAMGAIASGDVRVLNHRVIASVGVSKQDIEAVALREAAQLTRRERLYRGDREPIAVSGRMVIVVDDGLATGATMRAAIVALRQRQAAAIVVAVPTAPPRTCAALEPEVDEIVCPRRPVPFGAVGLWYRDFTPTSDDEVRELLGRAARFAARLSGGAVRGRRGV